MKLSEGSARSFQAPASTRKFPSSQVYLFRSGPSDSDDSEEELDLMELRARRKEQSRRGAAQERVGDVVLLEREVVEGDSVTKLALQYGCQVAEIKRVNHLMQEQDLYALKSVKIPVKVNGLLTESSEERPAALQDTVPLITAGSEVKDRDDKQIDQYFRGIEQNIEAAAQMGVALSANYCIEAPVHSPLGRTDSAGGGDGGIQWWNAVCVMLLVGIVLPVFYIVYFKSQEPELILSPSNVTLPGNCTLPGARKVPPVHVPAEESVRPGCIAHTATLAPPGSSLLLGRLRPQQEPEGSLSKP